MYNVSINIKEVLIVEDRKLLLIFLLDLGFSLNMVLSILELKQGVFELHSCMITFQNSSLFQGSPLNQCFSYKLNLFSRKIPSKVSFFAEIYNFHMYAFWG